jgi:hypothetical protein
MRSGFILSTDTADNRLSTLAMSGHRQYIERVIYPVAQFISAPVADRVTFSVQRDSHLKLPWVLTGRSNDGELLCAADDYVFVFGMNHETWCVTRT